MAVGEKFPFLQFSNTQKFTFATGITATFSTGTQPDPEVRVQNASTAPVWIGMGTQSTTSGAVVGNGLCIPALTNAGAVQIFRTGGQTKLMAFTENATHTVILYVTGGEGGFSV